MDKTKQKPHNFGRALKLSGLEEEFIRFCRTGAGNAEVHEWAKRHPGLLALTLAPKSFKNIRRDLNCKAPAGGARAARGKAFYLVRGGRAVYQV